MAASCCGCPESSYASPRRPNEDSRALEVSSEDPISIAQTPYPALYFQVVPAASRSWVRRPLVGVVVAVAPNWIENQLSDVLYLRDQEEPERVLVVAPVKVVSV